MKNSIKIAVPKPCHEKWNSFAKTSKGGFCSSCQKEVVDFTTWSDERLKKYFKSLPGDTCGRFRPQQLGLYNCSGPKSKPVGWMSVFLAGILMLLAPRHVAAQQSPSRQHTEQYQAENKIGKGSSTVLSGIRVSGVVNSPEERSVIPGVNVLLKGTSNGTVTDADGKFSLTLEDPSSPPVLVFSFIGFKSIEYPVDVATVEQNIEVDMKLEIVTLGEVIVGGATMYRWYSPRMWWWRLRGIFRNR